MKPQVGDKLRVFVHVLLPLRGRSNVYVQSKSAVLLRAVQATLHATHFPPQLSHGSVGLVHAGQQLSTGFWPCC